MNACMHACIRSLDARVRKHVDFARVYVHLLAELFTRVLGLEVERVQGFYLHTCVVCCMWVCATRRVGHMCLYVRVCIYL